MNRFNRLTSATRFLSLCSVLVFLAGTVRAQELPVDSYRALGLGEFVPQYTAGNLASGGLSSLYNSPRNNSVNFFNPAANTDIEYAIFQLGFNQDLENYKTSTSDTSKGFNYVSGMALGFPITKDLKFGIAYLPTSITEWESTAANADGSTDISSRTGGLNEVKAVAGYSITDNFSLGLGFSTKFGTLSNTTRNETVMSQTTIDNSLLVSGALSEEIAYKDKYNTADVSFGLHYELPIDEDNKILLAGTYIHGFDTSLDIERTDTSVANYSVISQTTNESGEEVLTILSEDDETYPEAYKDQDVSQEFQISETTYAGVSGYSVGLGYENEGKWMIGADYAWKNTENLVAPTGSENFTYQDSYRVAAGGWFLPNANSPSNYFDKVTYHLGGFYEVTPLVVAGQEVEDYGVNFGFGLPIGVRSPTELNLAFTIGKKGATSGEQLTDINYYSVRATINFAGKWFKRQLFD